MNVGADGIELDVRLARDGVPVVIHDATLRRTGLKAGSIGRLDSKQLADIDVGTWFNQANPKLARSVYGEEGVPALAQVFELFRKRPATIYLEMKTEKDDGTELAHAVVKLVKDFRFQDRVVVVSFDLLALARLKSMESSIRTGALFGSTWIGHRHAAENILAAIADCGADELLLNRLLARRRLVKRAQDADLPVTVWTVDDVKWVERARLLTLHALITNQPAKLLAAS